jgi:hypothetical protein
MQGRPGSGTRPAPGLGPGPAALGSGPGSRDRARLLSVLHCLPIIPYCPLFVSEFASVTFLLILQDKNLAAAQRLMDGGDAPPKKVARQN